jgi:hypothetical protein
MVLQSIITFFNSYIKVDLFSCPIELFWSFFVFYLFLVDHHLSTPIYLSKRKVDLIDISAPAIGMFLYLIIVCNQGMFGSWP